MDTEDMYERWNAAKLAEYLRTYIQGKARLKGPRSIFFESLLRNEKALQQMEGPNHYLRHALATLRTLDAPDKMERALALIPTQGRWRRYKQGRAWQKYGLQKHQQRVRARHPSFKQLLCSKSHIQPIKMCFG